MSKEISNQTEKKQWTLYGVIVSYLETPKNRLVFMMPQIILWSITLANLWLNSVFGVALLPFIAETHIVSAIIIVITSWFMLYTDYKRKKKY